MLPISLRGSTLRYNLRLHYMAFTSLNQSQKPRTVSPLCIGYRKKQQTADSITSCVRRQKKTCLQTLCGCLYELLNLQQLCTSQLERMHWCSFEQTGLFLELKCRGKNEYFIKSNCVSINTNTFKKQQHWGNNRIFLTCMNKSV